MLNANLLRTPNTSEAEASFARQYKPVYNSRRPHLPAKSENRMMARVNFFKRVPLLANLSQAELESLARDFAPRRFRQGETIFQQGDAGQALYLIESGQVRIYVQSEEGQETSVIVYGPGDLFGELAVIDEGPRSASAIAMEDTVVHLLSRDRLREHMRRSPQLALDFLTALSVRVRYSTQQVGNLTLLAISGRLARKLLELAQLHGEVEPDGVRIDLALTQSDLASLVGTTRESVNKALGTFRRQGLVRMQRGHIVIVDADALRALGM